MTSSRSPVELAAVLLAGGRSRRMGLDKALLRAPGGIPLWQHQWQTLEALHPDRIAVSCRGNQVFSGCPPDSRLIDPPGDLTPAALIARCHRMLNCRRLIVLAVDLPCLCPSHLDRLRDEAGPSRGAAYVRGPHVEPMAAIYPSAMLDLPAPASGDLQSWIREAAARGWFLLVPAGPEMDSAFLNLNDPAALADWEDSAR